MAINTFSSGVNTSFSTQLNENFAERTKVLTAGLSSSSTSSTSAASLASISLTQHSSTTAYHIAAYIGVSSLSGNGSIVVRLTDGTNNTDYTLDVDGAKSSGYVYLGLDIFPTSSTQAMVGGVVGGASGTTNSDAGFADVQTLAGSISYSALNSIKLLGKVGTSGTIYLHGYSVQRVGI